MLFIHTLRTWIKMQPTPFQWTSQRVVFELLRIFPDGKAEW
jgi:hypothetical protein